MNRYNILCLMASFFFVFQLSSQTQIEQYSIDSLEMDFSKITDGARIRPLDSTYNQVLRLKKKVAKHLIRTKKSDLYNSFNNLYGRILVFTMHYHVMKIRSDSVEVYYTEINNGQFDLDDQSLRTMEVQYALFQSITRNLELALKSMDKAIFHAKKTKGIIDDIETYRALISIYSTSGNDFFIEEVLENIEQLIERNPQEEIPYSIRFYLALDKAGVLARVYDYKSVIKVLKDFNIDQTDDLYVKRQYYQTMSLAYLELGDVNMASKLIEEGSKVEKQFYPKQEHYINYKMWLYALKKDTSKAQYYYEKFQTEFIPRYKAIYRLPVYTLRQTALHDYLMEKHLGSPKKALENYELFIQIRDSITNSRSKERIIISNYKLKKIEEITRLEEENQRKELVLVQKQRYYLITSISIVLILLIIGTSLYFFRRKRDKIEKEFELAQAQEILAVKNSYIENLSHEFRTPITSITGYLSMIERHSLIPNKVSRYSNLAAKSCTSMIKSLDNFLTLIKLEKDTWEYEREVKSIDSFIKELAESFVGSASMKSIKLFYTSNIGENAELPYDYVKLKKIIENLLTNAIKYSGQDTSIFIAVTLEDNLLKLHIQDQGYGIAKEEIGDIFSRFYQSKNHTFSGGFGIGLSLVKELVDTLGGKISVESTLGVGSIFEVTLPIELQNYLVYLNQSKGDYQLLNDVEISNEYETKAHFPKALLVDDNLEIIKYMQEVLSPFLTCGVAYNGEEAIQSYAKDNYDIIISDLYMPLKNGLELKRELGKMNAKDDISTPFLLLTATPPKAEIIFDLGVEDMLIKPFDADELVTRVKRLVKNKIYRKELLGQIDQEHPIDKDIDKELLSKIHNTIRHNISNSNFKVGDLASAIGYSQKQLNRILNVKTGLSAVKVILEIRLLKAYELIAEKKYKTVSEVMYAVGLTNMSYFSKVFKERFGINAKQFMDKYSI